MTKFNAPKTRSVGTTPFQTDFDASEGATTYEGAKAFVRTPQSELFLLGVTNFVSEKTFYEKAGDRDRRFADLVHTVAREDGVWLWQFIKWLRHSANMRSAALVAAAEYVRAHALDPVAVPSIPLSKRGKSSVRRAVFDALARADEPGEILAYYTSRYGRAIPKPLKRGVADAARSLYSEYSALKYDTQTRGYRFGDVIELTHPKPKNIKPKNPEPENTKQSDLFKYLIDRRHNRIDCLECIPESLDMVRERYILIDTPVEQRRALVESGKFLSRVGRAGLTWEFVSGWIQGEIDAQVWEKLYPNMGYMALLRNLRNFDEAGVSNAVADMVAHLEAGERAHWPWEEK